MIWIPERPGSRETQEWLDQLRDDRGLEPPYRSTAAAGPEVPGRQFPPRLAEPDARLRPRYPEPAAAAAGGRRGDPLSRPVRVTERAVIGDELRRPAVWCQLAPCVSRHADPGALGEADARARAISAGWREDRFGRFVCPACQQRSPDFWITQPVIQWNRKTAVIATSLMAARLSEGAVGAAGAETGVLPAALPVFRPPGHGRPEHGRPEHGRPERSRPERGRPECGRPEHGGPGHGGPAHAEPAHAEPAHAEPAHRWAPRPAAWELPGPVETLPGLPGPLAAGRHRRGR